MVQSNIINKEVLREVQSETFKAIAEAMATSYGSNGSNSQICRNLGENATKDIFATSEYTKDGHTILEKLNFNGIIEDALRSDLSRITSNTVKEVGDGTTTAVLLGQIIFESLKKYEEENTVFPKDIVFGFQKAVKDIQKKILENKREFTSQDAYDIAMVSTNGNEEMANMLKTIYDENGSEVYIETSVSPVNETIINKYNGMSLHTGFSDSVFMNNLRDKNCTIEAPQIYYFQDRVDTPDMIEIFNEIIKKNMLLPISNKGKTIPTVILSPFVSRDACTVLNVLIAYMHQLDNSPLDKPRFLLVSGIHEEVQCEDIARVCGCKPIKKYINPEAKKEDVKQGLAATPKNFASFAGTCEQVNSTVSGTAFVNPPKMEELQGTINFLEQEIIVAEREGKDIHEIGNYKRRLNSYKSNLIEYKIGGLDPMDKEAKKFLLDDAVLNIRSAAKNGVGWAASVEGAKASDELTNAMTETKIESDMIKLIADSYKKLLTRLYNSALVLEKQNVNDSYTLDNLVKDIVKKGPINLLTGQFDDSIKSSIKSDPVILNGIANIITLMITSTQAILPDFNYTIKYQAAIVKQNNTRK